MALTRDVQSLLSERLQHEPSFRRALLREGLSFIHGDDFQIGRAILRNYINATVGFRELARRTNIPSPSLQRMFGPDGNPRAENLFAVISELQKQEGVNVAIEMQHA